MQQYPAISSQGSFSGEHTFTEDLFPAPARRRRGEPKKPIISKKIWKSVNTPAVRAGEQFAKSMMQNNLEMENAAAREKMARQMYERNSLRFTMSNATLNRETLETRAGQKPLGTSSSIGSNGPDFAQLSQENACLSLPRSSNTGAYSRAKVLPGDLLASLERYSRNAGSLLHEKKSILPNGFLSRDGHRQKVHPHFQVDETQRVTRRVVTGGATDRLNYSDGSLLVLLPPKVIASDAALASKPLLLRDGTQSTIRSRTLPRPYPPRTVSTAGDLTMEVPRLSTVYIAVCVCACVRVGPCSHRLIFPRAKLKA